MELLKNFILRNGFKGITISMFGNEIEIEPKITWYEIAFSVLIILPCVFFGAIGGAIGAVLAIINFMIIRKVNKWWLKALISLLFIGLGVVMCYFASGVLLVYIY